MYTQALKNQLMIMVDILMFLPLHFAGEGKPVLDWATRVKVAAGAARGIAYLHEDCNFLPLVSNLITETESGLHFHRKSKIFSPVNIISSKLY